MMLRPRKRSFPGLRAVFASASLRTRVLVTICLVVAAALAVMGTAGTVLLRGYLIGPGRLPAA